MKVLSGIKSIVRTTFFVSLLASSSLFASSVLITRHFSGIWDQPDQQSQGIILQIGKRGEDDKIGIAYWFTYGEDLQTTWYFAVGPINGNEINMKLYTAFNVEFMGDNLEGNANVEEVGTLDLIFRNCNHGRAVFVFGTPEDVIDSGEFRIKRISSIYRTRCSGGISDDRPVDAKPLQLEVRLLPVRDDLSGKGKAKFQERAERTDFKVELEGVPGASYTLEVCSDVRGEMQITDGRGELEFRSPASDSKPLLDFDPRDENCRIELLDGEGVAYSSGDAVLSEKHP